MKKIFLPVTFLLFILASCEVNDNPSKHIGDSSSKNFIYKRPENYVSSSSAFDNHIVSIEKLSVNSKRDD